MGDTTIEWTDRTWNPIRGCSRISPGCGGPKGKGGCYAERIAARFSKPGMWGHGLAVLQDGKARWTGRVELAPDMLDAPLRWKKPQRIFVNSMSDLFHEALPDEAIDRVLAVMLLAPHHTFQVLTKRAERMQRYLSDPELYERVLRAAVPLRSERPRLMGIAISNPVTFPARWIWWGVSVEDQERANERIPYLLRTPAAVRFLSCEPLLEHVDLKPAPLHQPPDGSCWMPNKDEPDDWKYWMHRDHGLSWVIVGGESGAGARSMDLAWARSIVEQCKGAGVPCFVKQLGARPVGEWGPNPPTHHLTDSRTGRTTEELSRRKNGVWKLLSKKGGELAQMPEDLRVREWPRAGGTWRALRALRSALGEDRDR